MSDGYNGWSNYETWAMALWIDNEEGSYNAVRESAREAYENAVESPETPWDGPVEQARIYLADQLHDEFNEAMPDLDATVWADLLNAAFSEVDWTELAGYYVDEFKSEVDA